MSQLLLHTCCGPCSTVAVPAWRARGIEPLAWFNNPSIQPAAELERRRDSMRRYSRAAGLELIMPGAARHEEDWLAWAEELPELPQDERCRRCLGLRLDAAGAAAVLLGIPRFSTTLSVSPYQRHDLIAAAGEEAARRHGADFVYLDLRPEFRESYAESRRFQLYRQPYCGCVVSKWAAWYERRRRRRSA
jgi:predicted adenine nucleotide alpha hydrolase (AANH) superfamily ATPase